MPSCYNGNIAFGAEKNIIHMIPLQEMIRIFWDYHSKSWFVPNDS